MLDHFSHILHQDEAATVLESPQSHNPCFHHYTFSDLFYLTEINNIWFAQPERMKPQYKQPLGGNFSQTNRLTVIPSMHTSQMERKTNKLLPWQPTGIPGFHTILTSE